jgi:hypothetical protein
MISRNQLIERKVNLIAERDNLLANLSAYNGAIQDCEFWLLKIDEMEKQDALAVPQRSPNGQEENSNQEEE